MFTPLVLTLSCSVAALVILGVALRRGRFFTYVGALFVVMMVVFHAVSEVVARLNPQHDRYRRLVGQAVMDGWLMWAGPAILAGVLGYLAVLRRARAQPVADDTETVRFLDWRWCLLATVPVYLVAVRGEGFVAGTESEGDTYFTAGVTEQFLLLGVVLTAFALTMRFGRFMPIAIGQSVALLLLGQRATVVGGIVILCFLLARQQRAPSRRQLAMLAIAGIVGSLALSSARVLVGRAEFAAGQGAVARVEALVVGIGGLLDEEVRSDLSGDFVYRLDGNVFPALILEARQTGRPPANIQHLRVATNVAVPSFVDPGKKARPETERDEKAYLVRHYRLAGNVDFMPAFLGSWVAIGGPLALLMGAALFGAVLGGVDRWLRGASPARAVIAAGVVACVVRYPRGFQVVPVTMRGALTIAAVVWVLHFAHRMLRLAQQPREMRGDSDDSADDAPHVAVGVDRRVVSR